VTKPTPVEAGIAGIEEFLKFSKQNNEINQWALDNLKKD
jgi:hypothetical protein